MSNIHATSEMWKELKLIIRFNINRRNYANKTTDK